MNAPSNLDLQLANCSFTQLNEVYRLLKVQGETLDIAALIRLAPHLETEIREQFPLITLLDNVMGEDENNKTNLANLPTAVAGCILHEEIGRGGMGVVFRAHQPELNRDVAIKVIQLNSSSNSNSDRFELERHALARLEHPNVVPAYSFTQDSKNAYLVMKLISGCGLNQLLNGECDYKATTRLQTLRSDWIAFSSMAADVASGLQHAHDNGLIHRDIKPANLLVDTDGKVWISDFGLAKMSGFAQIISRTGDVVGTPKYMAPEQIQGVSDPRSDVYSLGVTLYELAAGKSDRSKAWTTNQTLQHSLPQIQDIRELNPEIPDDLANVVMKACRFLPEDRYQSAEELEVVLRRFLDGRVADRRKKKRKPDAVFRKEFRRKAILSIAGSMLLCGAITLYLLQRSQADSGTQWGNQHGNFLDKLADSNTKQCDKRFAEHLRGEVMKAAEQLQLPKEEKQGLVAEINVMYEQIKEGNVSHAKIGELLDKYKDSNFAMATKIWRIAPHIQRSRMRASEKEYASLVLQRFAFLVTKKRIPVTDVIRLKNSLTEGKSVSVEELGKLQFSTNQLRNWVAKVDSGTKGLVQPGEEIRIVNDIRNLFVTEQNSSSGNTSIKASANQKKNKRTSAPAPFPSPNSRTITADQIEKIKSGLTPEKIKQLRSRFNGVR